MTGWQPVLRQLADGLAFWQDGDRPAGEVLELMAVVDAEVPVGGRQQVLGGERPLLGILALAVGGADDLAGAQAAAGQQRRHGVGPVVAAYAAVGLADLRSAAELAGGD